MKKISFEEIKWYLTLSFWILVFLAIFFYFTYLEENYEIIKYLNIFIIINIPLYYFIYNYREKAKKKKLEKSIIIKNIDFQYYRDIIEGYSPAMLSFILDGIEVDKDIAASIIYLINKGYLKLENNKIERIEKDSSKLPKDLQIFYNSDVNHLLACRKLSYENPKEEIQAKISSQTLRQWYDSIEKQAVEEGLVIERKDDYRMLSLFSILCILELIYALGMEKYGLACIATVLLLVLIFIRIWAFDKNKWIKTQKGYEIYSKIVGLKNYINDYSTLTDRQLDEIVVWEDYLIYAIIFNNTSKLSKEAIEFYEKVCNLE